ncbi:putative uncharacterized protein DDB_G0282133 [Ctenocephalides felis]|uniref:putative uncharacterized protein DDB_G0282133 n=1 Tax=Ctenocephalides felis TaxID=7515 RepID=UPI000E6E56FC|nr:putative uncharacterized protein DDB_G0282133 [Ctenocephalides felis]
MRFLASLLICSWAVLVTPAPEYLRSYQRSYTSSTSNGPPKYKTMVSQMQGALKKSLAQQCGSRTSCRTYYSSSHEGSSSNTNTDSTTNYNDQLMASLRQKVESQSSYSSSTPDVPTEYINMDPQVQEAIKKSLAQQSGYRTSYSRTYSSSSHEESSSNTNTDSVNNYNDQLMASLRQKLESQGNTATSSSRYTTSQSSPGYTRTTYSYVKPQTYVTGTDHQVNTHNLEHDREQDKNSDEQRLVPGGYSRTTSFSRTGSSSHSSSQNRPGYVRRTYTSSSSFGEPNSQFINSENKRTESTPHVHDDKCEHDVEQENNAQDTDNLNQHGTSGYRRTTYSSSSSTSYNSSRNRPQYTVTSYHSTSNLNSNRDSQVGVTENQENNENHEHRLEDNSDEDDDGQRIVNAGQYSKTTNSSRTVSHSSSSSTNYNSSRNRPQYTVTSYYSTSNLNSNRDSQVGLTENQENNENHEDRLEDNNDEDDDAQRIVNAGQYSKTANSSQTVSHSSSSSTSYNSSRNRPQYTVTSYHSTSNLNSNRDSQVGLTENQENNENHEHRLEDNNDEDDDAQRVVNAGQYSKTAKSSQTVSHSSSSSSGFSSTHSRPGYTRTTYHSTSSYGTPHSSVINKSGNKDNDGNLHIHSENCEHDIEKNNDDTNNNPNSQNANQQGTSGYSRTVSYSGSSSASHNTNRNIEQYSGTRYNSVTDSSTSSYSDVGSALNKQENNSADHIHSDKCEHDIEKNSVDDDEQSIVNKGQRTQTSGFTRTTSYSDSDLSSTGSNHYRPGYTRTTYHSSSSYGTQNSNNGDGQDNAGKLHVHSENCEHDKENSSDLNGSENHAQNVGRHRITSYSHTVSSNSRTTGFNSSQNRQGYAETTYNSMTHGQPYTITNNNQSNEDSDEGNKQHTQNAGQHSQSAGHAQTISYYRAGSFIRNSSQSELGYSESTSSIDTNNSQQNNSVHGGSFEHGKNTVEQTTENLQQNSHTRGNYGTTSQSHSTSSRYTSNQNRPGYTITSYHSTSSYAKPSTQITENNQDTTDHIHDENCEHGNNEDYENHQEQDIGQQSISTGHSHTGLTRYTSSHTSSEHRTASNYARNTTEKNINKEEGSDENSSEEDEYDSAGNSNDKRNKPGGKGWKKYYWEKDFIPPGHRNKPHPRGHAYGHRNRGQTTSYSRYNSNYGEHRGPNRYNVTTTTYSSSRPGYVPSRYSTSGSKYNDGGRTTYTYSSGGVRYSTSNRNSSTTATDASQNVYEDKDTQFAPEVDGTGFEHGSYDTNTGTSAIDSDSRHSSNRSTSEYTQQNSHSNNNVSTHSGSTGYVPSRYSTSGSRYNDGGRTTYTYSSGGVRYSTSNRNSSTTAYDASQNVYEGEDTQFAQELDGTGFEHGSYDTNTGTSAIDSDSRHSSNRSTFVSTHSGSTSTTQMINTNIVNSVNGSVVSQETQKQNIENANSEHISAGANSEEKKHRSNVSMHSGSKTTNSSYTLVSQYSQSSHESNSAKHKVITDSSSDEDSYEILDQRTEKYEATTNSGDTFFENQNIVSNNYASTSKIVEESSEHSQQQKNVVDKTKGNDLHYITNYNQQIISQYNNDDLHKFKNTSKRAHISSINSTSEESKQFVISHFTNKSAEHKSDNYASANNQQFNLQQNKENININKSATNLIESTTFTKYNFSSSEERNEQLQSGSLQISQQYRPTNFKGDALSSHDFLENEKHKSNSEIKNASVDRNHHQQQSGSHGRNSSDIRSTSSISYSSQNISGQYHVINMNSGKNYSSSSNMALNSESTEADTQQKVMNQFYSHDNSSSNNQHISNQQNKHQSTLINGTNQNIAINKTVTSGSTSYTFSSSEESKTTASQSVSSEFTHTSNKK